MRLVVGAGVLTGSAHQEPTEAIDDPAMPHGYRPSVDLTLRTRIAAYGLAVAGELVLLARASDKSAMAGTWWLPGGGIEFGEAPAAAFVREFAEETGLTVQVVRLIDVLSDVAERDDINERLQSIRVIYEVEVLSGELQPEMDGTTDTAAGFHVARPAAFQSCRSSARS